jgi:hypothetical protein
MRVFLCYHGLSGSLSEKKLHVDPFFGITSVVQNVVKANPNVEFVLCGHTWESSNTAKVKATLMDINEPNCTYVELEVQVRRTFEETERIYNDKLKVTPDEMTVYTAKDKLNGIISKNFSAKRAIMQAQKMITPSDWVCLLRFDLIFLKPLQLGVLSETTHNTFVSGWHEIHETGIPPVIDSFKFTVDEGRERIKWGYMDYFVFISSTQAVQFADLYDRIGEYLNSDSEMVSTTKWPIVLSGHPLLYWHLRQLQASVGVLCNQSDVILQRDFFTMRFMECYKRQEYVSCPQIFEEMGPGKHNSLELTWAMTEIHDRLGNIEAALRFAHESLHIAMNRKSLHNIIALYDKLRRTNECVSFCRVAIHTYPDSEHAEVYKSIIQQAFDTK